MKVWVIQSEDQNVMSIWTNENIAKECLERHRLLVPKEYRHKFGWYISEVTLDREDE